MRIGIDAHMLGHFETGNETYIRELVRALVELESGDEFFILVEDEAYAPISPRSNCHIIRISTRSAVRRLLFDLPRLARKWRFDLLHVTYNAPFVSPCPFVVTVHDVSFARHPEFFSLRDRWVLNTLVPRSVRRARAILTDTEFAKRDLIEIYHLAAEKIVVTPYAAGAQFRPHEDRSLLAAIRKKYQTSEHYLLAVGNLQPRKNLGRLIEAYAQAVREDHIAAKLVLVGQQLWGGVEVVRAVEANGLTDRVVFAGFVPEDELVLLYNAASVFVLPSLYEGFGLPVIEAMACGTPVIASNVSALPEVTGDAALLVDPCDINDLAEALARATLDRALHSEMKAKGLDRASRFSWRETAQKTLIAYRAAVNAEPDPSK